MNALAGLYLDLLKRTLTGMTYEDPPLLLSDPDPAGYYQALRAAGCDDPLSRPYPPGYDPVMRAAGADVPQHAPCMIGTGRLDTVQHCVESALADGISGDLAEAGCWRGGTAIFMRALLKMHRITDRLVWVIDSFAGLPSAHPDEAFLAVPLDEVRHNFGLYGLLDDQVRFLPGWFCDTLPGPVGQLAVLRFDGDRYESARDVLEFLYPRLVPGGYLIVDDPRFPEIRKAVWDYRDAHGITAPYREAGPSCAYWRKEPGEHTD